MNRNEIELPAQKEDCHKYIEIKQHQNIPMHLLDQNLCAYSPICCHLKHHELDVH